ncbi:MAG: NAD+ synthase (glutamine-hydrolyzing), partial [bacterium]
YEFDTTEENLQSRIRGTLLMGLSNKYGSLLLTTGNKSELAVGYCTIYGDMNGGLAVISDVPKTMVFKLCRWVNKEFNDVIPWEIIDKPPSAELREDQKDQDSLPEYDILDEILERSVEKHQSFDELLEAGLPEKDIRRVLHLLKIAEFKRNQAAPGLKVTDRAFGTGWRAPIACRLPHYQR